MKKNSAIQVCAHCQTKVLPTQEGRCPACQHEFDSPEVTVPGKKKPAEHQSSWIPLLLLGGMIALAGLMDRRKKRGRHLKLVA